jgi:hypothetical protein
MIGTAIHGRITKKISIAKMKTKMKMLKKKLSTNRAMAVIASTAAKNVDLITLIMTNSL